MNLLLIGAIIYGCIAAAAAILAVVSMKNAPITDDPDF